MHPHTYTQTITEPFRWGVELGRLNRDIKGTRTVKPAQAGINAMASIGKQRMNASPQVSKLSPLRSPSEERQLLVQVFKGYGPNEGQMPG